MEFAAAEKLEIGVHYCSADNRNSAQVNLQNKPFVASPGLQAAYPWMKRGEDDPFLKCAKAFGDDAAAVRDWAAGAGVPCDFNPAVPSAAFPCAFVPAVREACPSAVLGESANVLEQQPDGSFCMREVGLRELAAAPCCEYEN